MNRWILGLGSLLAVLPAAQAHFVWLLPASPGQKAQVIFSDSLEPDDAKYLEKIVPATLYLRTGENTRPVKMERGKDSLLVALPEKGPAVVAGTCKYGVLKKGETPPFLLVYHARALYGAGPWSTPLFQQPLKEVALEIVPAKDKGSFQVLWQGKPLADAEVVALVPGKDESVKLKSNAQGRFALTATEPGTYGIRARHFENEKGAVADKKYESIRHYATLTFVVGKGASSTAAFPPLPEGFSSFGAAVSDGFVYVYGGHVAPTHQYSTEAVTGKFRRLNLGAPSKGWEELPAGPGLQGLALVAHRSKLYRIGGMHPRNKPGDRADNVSVASASVFDPQTTKWQALPDLPAPRSSHDAVVVGDLLVVVGGWQMNGQGKPSDWHQNALILDLSKNPLQWQSIPQPFERRALNAAVCDGKVYVVGGMSSDEGTQRVVDILDPGTKRWSKGPSLPGPARNGFSPAVCANGPNLYASPFDGRVYVLTRDAWREIGALQTPRVVHRIVPVRDNLLLVLGGASKGENVSRSETFRTMR